MTLKINWYGHACFLIETNGTKLLTDPFITGNPLSPVQADAVEADYILVSHGHGDHLGDTIDIAKRTGATVISNFEIQNWLVGKGIQNGLRVNFERLLRSGGAAENIQCCPGTC